MTDMGSPSISKALIKAYNLRQPARGLVFHSDRGSQYTSKQFSRLLSSYGIRASMGDVGACSATATALLYLLHPCSCGIMPLLSDSLTA